MASICLTCLSVLEEFVLLLFAPCALYFVDYYYAPSLLSVLSDSFLYHDQLKVFNRTQRYSGSRVLNMGTEIYLIFQ